MKIQIVIISALIINVFTLPVPDEEVSPVQLIPAVKPDPVSKPETKPVEVVNLETLREKNEENLSEVPTNTPDPMQPKIFEISKAPDAELPQLLLNKETTKSDQSSNIDNKLEKVKILSDRESPVASIEKKKQDIKEPKPEIVNLGNEAKSTISGDSVITKEKVKEQLPNVSENIQISKYEPLTATSELTEPLIPLHSEETQQELLTRQERGNEEKAKEVKPVVDHIQHIMQSTHSTNAKTEVKSSKPEKTSIEEIKSVEFHKAVAEKSEKIIPEEKPLEVKTLVTKFKEAHTVPAGDVLLQSSEENNIKSLNIEKKTQPQLTQDYAVLESKKTETKPDELEATYKLKAKETKIKFTDKSLEESSSQTAPVGQLVEAKIDSNKNLQDSKEFESSESKESGESKEIKKD